MVFQNSFRNESLEVSFSQQTSQCKSTLGNTSDNAELSKSYLKQKLSSIRRSVFQKEVNYSYILEEYNLDVIEHVTSGMDYSWEKTEDYNLWRGLRSHEALLETIKNSCKVKKFISTNCCFCLSMNDAIEYIYFHHRQRVRFTWRICRTRNDGCKFPKPNHR